MTVSQRERHECLFRISLFLSSSQVTGITGWGAPDGGMQGAVTGSYTIVAKNKERVEGMEVSNPHSCGDTESTLGNSLSSGAQSVLIIALTSKTLSLIVHPFAKSLCKSLLAPSLE